jgi:hypothetical protein
MVDMLTLMLIVFFLKMDHPLRTYFRAPNT